MADNGRTLPRGDRHDDQINREREKFVRGVRRDAIITHTTALLLLYIYLICRVVALSGSAAIPVLALYGPEKIVTAIVGAIVFGAEVLIRVGQPGGHSISQHRKAYALEHECRRYLTGVPPYAETDSKFEKFEERVRAIRLKGERSEELILQQAVGTGGPSFEKAEDREIFTEGQKSS